MDIDVETHPGHRGMLMPQGFELGARRVEVIETIDQWFGPDYRYIKVKGDDDGLYILRVDDVHATWQLTMFESTRGQAVSVQRVTQMVGRPVRRTASLA
ncbi:MAG: hypothetical protein ABSG76_10440 [Xanthobacteraceae bacterium]|jgi:hypothetical protein